MKQHTVKIEDITHNIKRTILASASGDPDRHDKQLSMSVDLGADRADRVTFFVFEGWKHVITTPDLKEAVRHYNQI